MAVVSNLLTDALLQATVIGIDQQLPDSMAQIALRRFQRMIDSWANVRDLIFATTTETFTMTANQAEYSTTLLAGGRPAKIDSMFARLSQIDYAVTMRDQEWYDQIAYKPTSAIPNNCFYNASMPNGAMFFYPTPYAAFECHVVRVDPLTGTMTVGTTLTMPPGYEKAFVDALAVDLYPSFKGAKPIPPDLKASANEAKRVLKVTNFNFLEMNTPFDGYDTNLSNSFLYKGW